MPTLQVGKRQWERVLDMVGKIRGLNMEVCTTLGMLTPEQAAQLRSAGLTAYNHNLDTSPEYYPKVTSSRKYQVHPSAVLWCPALQSVLPDLPLNCHLVVQHDHNGLLHVCFWMTASLCGLLAGHEHGVYDTAVLQDVTYNSQVCGMPIGLCITSYRQLLPVYTYLPCSLQPPLPTHSCTRTLSY